MSERIWLQVSNEFGEPSSEISWCEDKINGDDVEYILVEKHAQLEAKLAQREQDCIDRTVEAHAAEADNEALREQYAHIIAWINQPEGLLTIKQLTDDINIIDENGKKKSYSTKKDDIERFIMFMNKNYGVETSKYYCFIPKKDKDGQILSKLLSVL